VLGRALRHPPGWIALGLAKRTAEKIGDLVISHLMEIAILKADCVENDRHLEADGIVRCLASASGGATGTARTSEVDHSGTRPAARPTSWYRRRRWHKDDSPTTRRFPLLHRPYNKSSAAVNHRWARQPPLRRCRAERSQPPLRRRALVSPVKCAPTARSPRRGDPVPCR
jgi:hypothetical protein